MRIYLPATLRSLARAVADDGFGPPPMVAFAVTPRLRESYASGDAEELEFAAYSQAVSRSLAMLSEDPDAPRRRVVVAADVADEAVRDASGGGSRRPGAPVGEVRAAVAVGRRAWASVHVDDVRAADVVARAASSLPTAGDEDEAAWAVAEAEGEDLLWWGVQEVGDLLTGS